MDKIVDIEVKNSGYNLYSKYVEKLYKVGWHGFALEEDTWEPT